jgi:hypothetical protein
MRPPPPPPHARLPILLARLPADAPPCGPEPVTFYDGKMYLRPAAHAHLAAEDLVRLNALCVGEAFGYLLARGAGVGMGVGVHRPLFAPLLPLMTGNKEKATGPGVGGGQQDGVAARAGGAMKG